MFSSTEVEIKGKDLSLKAFGFEQLKFRTTFCDRYYCGLMLNVASI